MEWDYTAYRVIGLPSSLNSAALIDVLSQILQIEASSIRIHSLAAEAVETSQAAANTATVSFRSRPSLLQLGIDKWSFDLPSDIATTTLRSRICIDTHFCGFTPLSPVDGITASNGQSIEYEL